MAGDLQKNKTQTREAFFLDGSLPDFADIMSVQICLVENVRDWDTNGTALVIKGLCDSEEEFYYMGNGYAEPKFHCLWKPIWRK